MSIADILIILGCLAAGYWIVHSIMGPGIDITRAGREATDAREQPDTHKPSDAPKNVSAVADWHIVLDIPRDASRRDIEAALKRRLAAAESSGDTAAAARVRQAAEYALRQRH